MPDSDDRIARINSPDPKVRDQYHADTLAEAREIVTRSIRARIARNRSHHA